MEKLAAPTAASRAAQAAPQQVPAGNVTAREAPLAQTVHLFIYHPGTPRGDVTEPRSALSSCSTRIALVRSRFENQIRKAWNLLHVNGFPPLLSVKGKECENFLETELGIRMRFCEKEFEHCRNRGQTAVY